MFVVASDPALKFLSSLFWNDFDSIVHEAQADTLRSPLVDNLQAASILFNHFVPTSSIHEEDHCSSIFKDGFVLRPTIQRKLGAKI